MTLCALIFVYLNIRGKGVGGGGGAGRGLQAHYIQFYIDTLEIQIYLYCFFSNSSIDNFHLDKRNILQHWETKCIGFSQIQLKSNET